MLSTVGGIFQSYVGAMKSELILWKFGTYVKLLIVVMCTI
jgi:hypothetical protein